MVGAATADRILWRCRRGMKELDLLLERFAREHYDRAPEWRRRAFERLLELPDPVLVELLLERPPTVGARDLPGLPQSPGLPARNPPSDRDLAEVAALVAAAGRR